MQENAGTPAAASQKKLLALMMAMFFAFGFCTVLVDTLIPKLKAMFALTYAEVMLTQFCFFGAYLIISAPAGWLLMRVGYLRGITVGLLIMVAGALMFTPAALYGTYPGFLAALFTLASGITIVQAAANPLTAQLGDRTQAPSRLTLAQAFNSLATMVGPIVGSSLILAHVATFPDPATTPPALLTVLRQQEARVFEAPFLGIAAVLLALATLCWSVRRWAPSTEMAKRGSYRHVLSNPRLVLGAISIFTYVGAEVSIGSSIANYLMQNEVLGIAAQQAGRLVSIYWGLAMVGRFCGTAVLRVAPPGLVLAAAALCAGALAGLTAGTTGLIAAASVLTIGFFNSIMFPTIFTLAIETSGEEEAEASGILCMAIVGGAVVPLLTGVAADRFGLAHALLVPALCYAWILYYGVSVHQEKRHGPAAAGAPGLQDLAGRN